MLGLNYSTSMRKGSLLILCMLYNAGSKLQHSNEKGFLYYVCLSILGLNYSTPMRSGPHTVCALACSAKIKDSTVTPLRRGSHTM